MELQNIQDIRGQEDEYNVKVRGSCLQTALQARDGVALEQIYNYIIA